MIDRRVHSPRSLYCLALGLLLGASPLAYAQPAFIDSSKAKLPPTVRYERGMDVDAADLDRDGDLDLVIANEFQPNNVLLNDGLGNFTQPTGILPSHYHDSEDLGVADFDGDGDLDLVFVSEDDSTHEYYLNDGAGRFADAPFVLPSSIANAVAVADINGDRHPDLLIGNAGQDFLLVNDGAGRFTDETAGRLPAETNVTQDVEFADLDGDGDLDIVVGNEDGNRLLDNDGTGVFVDVTAQRLPLTPNTETRKVTFADVDGDGDLDIYFSNVGWNPANNGQDRLYINNKGIFTDETSQRLPPSDQSTLDAKFVDADDDGDLDLITCHFPQSRPRAWRNDGTGRFADATADILGSPVNGDGLGIEIFDANGDGRSDIYFCDRGNRDRLFIRAMATTSVGAEKAGEAMARCAPNPFGDETAVEFTLEHDGLVAVAVHSVTGETLAQCAPQRRGAGHNIVMLNTSGLPKGPCFVTVTSDGGRMVLPVVRG